MSVGSRKLNLAYQGLSEMPAELTNHHTALIEELDLTGNRIVDLKFLIEYQNLETLVLDHNNIRSHVKMAQLPRLHTLWVNHNRINNLGVFISTLAKNCPSLRILSMMNNDAAPSYFNSGTFQQYMDYRYFVISKLPKLQLLDDKKVMADERSEAERIYKPVPNKDETGDARWNGIVVAFMCCVKRVPIVPKLKGWLKDFNVKTLKNIKLFLSLHPEEWVE